MLTASWKKSLLTASMAAMLTFGLVLVPAADVFAAQVGTATVQSGVNMRTSPSTSGSIIRMLKKGESLVVLEKMNSYWYKVQDSSGQIGYVSTSSQYLSVTLSSSGGSTSTPIGSTNATIVKTVNFRTGASTSASTMGYLYANEKVTIVSVPNSYWYEVVDSKGRRGYVSSQSQYINVTGSLQSGSATSTGRTSCSTRTSTSTSTTDAQT
jgi:peptidoglycan DL-endopeptidase CwlO